MARRLYKGYSSFEHQDTGSFSINDVELVKLDLLNHIFTRRGERVMMPKFGTIIPDLAFEPLDSDTIDILEEELMDVFNYDPRVEVVRLKLTPAYEHNAIAAECVLYYVELNITDSFELNIEFEDS